MEFKSNTLYDKNRLVRYNRFYFFKNVYIFILLAVDIVLLSIVAATYGFGSYLIVPAVFLAILACFYILVCFFLPVLTVKKNPAFNSVERIEFCEDKMRIDETRTGSHTASEVEYSSILKMMESKQDIYLFITKSQAYIIDKTTVTGGTPEELIAFLKGKNIRYKKFN